MRNWLQSDFGKRTVVCLLLCALPLLGFWLTGLYDLDEGFYGAVTREMIWRGDFVTPYYMGSPWFEKPILLYWLSVPSVLAFGEMLGPRLPSVLTTLLTVWVLISFVRRERGEVPALVTGFVYGTSLLVIAMGRLMTTDAILALCMVILFTEFWRSINGEPKRRWVAAAALGFAVLAKGPVAGLFFLLIIGITYWRLPSLRSGFKGNWMGPILLGFTVIALWYVPAYLANGDLFVQEFLIKQNIGRFRGGDEAHQTPWWTIPIFYPLVLALGFALPLVPAIKSGLFKRADDALTAYLWIWFGVIFVFFSISGSKLPHYILPAAAPLAMLMGIRIGSKPDIQLRRIAVPAVMWSVFAMVLTNFVLITEDKRNAELHRVIKAVRNLPEPTIAYPVGRTESQTDISFEFAERSHPSIFFYMSQPGGMIAGSEEFDRQELPFVLVTKQAEWERVEQQLIENDWLYEPVKLDFEAEKWSAYRVQSR